MKVLIRNIETVFFVCGMIILFAISFGATLYFAGGKTKELVNSAVNFGSGLLDVNTPAGIPESSINVLLLGYGGEGHSGGGLADSINLLHIEPDRKIAALIFIPRDSWVNLPVRSDLNEFHKINDAFAIGNSDSLYPLKEPKYKGEHGGGEMMKVGVKQITGFEPSYYLAVDFDRFIQAIDKLGGVKIDVQNGFSDSFYPVKGLENELCGKSANEVSELHQKYTGFELEKQFACRYETLTFNLGVQTMNGETALKYARSRHSGENGSDFARGMRQQEILEGIAKQILALENTKKMVNSAVDFLSLVKTDVSVNTVGEISKIIVDPTNYTIKKINIPNELLANNKNNTGQYILIPKLGESNWTEIQDYIKQELAK